MFNVAQSVYCELQVKTELITAFWSAPGSIPISKGSVPHGMESPSFRGPSNEDSPRLGEFWKVTKSEQKLLDRSKGCDGSIHQRISSQQKELDRSKSNDGSIHHGESGQQQSMDRSILIKGSIHQKKFSSPVKHGSIHAIRWIDPMKEISKKITVGSIHCLHGSIQGGIPATFDSTQSAFWFHLFVKSYY